MRVVAERALAVNLLLMPSMAEIANGICERQEGEPSGIKGSAGPCGLSLAGQGPCLASHGFRCRFEGLAPH
jgi:hypothetical protein